MLEQGVYTLAEVATYTKVRPSTLRRWFWERSDNAGLGPIFVSDYKPIGNDFAISFLNLIEVRVGAFFRAKGVMPSVIRKTYQKMQVEMGTPHPFAHEKLRTDGKRIILKSDDKEVRDAFDGQFFFGHVWKNLHQLKFSKTSHLAEAWQISKGVWISPQLGFGKPVIENTGVSSLIVARQYRANGKDAELVARLFNIPKKGVEDAVRFEKSLGRLAA